MKKLVTLIVTVVIFMTANAFAADKAKTTTKTKITTVDSVGTTGFLPQAKGAKVNQTLEAVVAYATKVKKPKITPSNTCWNDMWQDFADYLHEQIIVWMSAQATYEDGVETDLHDDEDRAFEMFLQLKTRPVSKGTINTIGLTLNKNQCEIEGLADAINRAAYPTIDDLKTEWEAYNETGAMSLVCLNPIPGIQYKAPKINSAEFDEDDRISQDVTTKTQKSGGITNIINVYGATATVSGSGNSTMTTPATTTSVDNSPNPYKVRKKTTTRVYEEEPEVEEEVVKVKKTKRYVEEEEPVAGCSDCDLKTQRLTKATLGLTTFFGLVNTGLGIYNAVKTTQISKSIKNTKGPRPPRGNNNPGNNNGDGRPSCIGAYKHYYANGEWQWKCPDSGNTGNPGGNTDGNGDGGNTGNPGLKKKVYNNTASVFARRRN